MVFLGLMLGLLSSGCSQVTVDAIDGPALAEVIEQHRGQIVLVDFWATWCPPCVEFFPHAVELHRQFADRGLTVISVSLDDPDERPAVLEFLQNHEARFDNYISTYGVGAEAFEAFEIDDGAIPHFKLYDRTGKLYKAFNSGNGLRPKEIDQAIEALLDEAS